MKILITVLMIGVVAVMLIAGCTTPVMQETPTPTTTITPLPTTTTQVSITDPELVGSWTLGEMGLQGGQAPLTVFPKPIIITFTGQGVLGGNDGCNNYQGSYLLTGNSSPFGKEIKMGPVIATMMYCAETADIETSYFQILSNVTAYGIDNSTILSMRDPVGSTLVYLRS